MVDQLGQDRADAPFRPAHDDDGGGGGNIAEPLELRTQQTERLEHGRVPLGPQEGKHLLGRRQGIDGHQRPGSTQAPVDNQYRNSTNGERSRPCGGADEK